MLDKKLKISALVAITILSFGCATKKTTTLNSDTTSSVSATSSDAPIDQRCSDDFAVLREYNPVAYKSYRMQFDKLSQVYTFYKAEAKRLGKDPKELMAMELESKLNQICSRVKYSVYVETQMRISPVSSL